jgi:hypothetical protein
MTVSPLATQIQNANFFENGFTTYESNLVSFFFFFTGLWGYWHCGHCWPIVPASGDNEDDCGEVDGM